MKNIHNMKYFIGMAACIIWLSSCEKNQTEENETAQGFCIPDSLMKNITLDTIRTETMLNDLKLSGKITFNQDNVVKLFPLLGGRVVDVKVSLGDYVKKGQLLAELKSSDMAGFFGDFKSAQSELVIAKKNLDVITEMKSSGISSDKDYITALSDYQKASAQFNKLNEEIKLYGNTIDPGDSSGSAYLIRSPIDGFIVEKNINTGMELRVDEENPLFTVSDLKEVWVLANVYETDISKIKEGSEAEVSTLSYPDRKYTGKIEQVSNILNPETNVMTVKIRLSNNDYHLKPGMFANISVLFPSAEKKLVVNSRSVLFDDNKNYLVLFRKRCDVKLLPVNIVKTFDDNDYLDADSLAEGDRVIARNNLFVFTALKKL